jgi:hypothetical protein
MFVKSHTEVPVEFSALRDRLLRCPSECLDAAADDARGHGFQLLADAGLEAQAAGADRAERRTRIEVGRPVCTDRVMSLPLHFLAEDRGRRFPTMEGSLDAAWLGPGRTHLSVTAQYEPPQGVLDRLVERVLLHRMVEAVAQRFVESVGRRLVA